MKKSIIQSYYSSMLEACGCSMSELASTAEALGYDEFDLEDKEAVFEVMEEAVVVYNPLDVVVYYGNAIDVIHEGFDYLDDALDVIGEPGVNTSNCEKVASAIVGIHLQDWLSRIKRYHTLDEVYKLVAKYGTSTYNKEEDEE